MATSIMRSEGAENLRVLTKICILTNESGLFIGCLCVVYRKGLGGI